MAYLVRRLALMPITLFLVSVVTFLAVHVASGDLALALATGGEGSHGSQEEVEAFRQRYGLDRPLVVQYGDWAWDTVRGDLGTSPWTGREVRSDLMQKLPVTVELTIFSVLIALLVGVPLGVISAVTRNSPIDYTARLLSLVALSVPNFWSATLAILIMFRLTGSTPSVIYTKFSDNPIANLQQLTIPAVVLGASMAAFTARFTRSSMLEVLSQEFVRTARAKGLHERHVIWRHVLPGAMIPVVTYTGIQFGALLGGSVVIEAIFSLPGLGRFLLDAISKRDFVSVQAMGLVIATGFVFANLFVDLAVLRLDPRIGARV